MYRLVIYRKPGSYYSEKKIRIFLNGKFSGELARNEKLEFSLSKPEVEVSVRYAWFSRKNVVVELGRDHRLNLDICKNFVRYDPITLLPVLFVLLLAFRKFDNIMPLQIISGVFILLILLWMVFALIIKRNRWIIIHQDEG